MQITNRYWCRLVKNIGGKPKYWGEMVVITDENIGFSQLLGARAWAAPQSLRLCQQAYCVTKRSWKKHGGRLVLPTIF